MWIHRHVGVSPVIILSCALVRWHTDIFEIEALTYHQAIQYTHFYTLEVIIHYHYWNTSKYAMNYSLDTWFHTHASQTNTVLLS